MDKTAETLIDVSGFISEYSAHMMGCGVHTSRKHSASCVFFSPLFLPTFVASL